MQKSEKEISVEEIKGKLGSAKVVILAEFQGMTVAETNELRKLFRESHISYKVYKNTLMGIAARELGLKGLDSYLSGTTALAVSEKEDISSPAKIVKDFSAKHQRFKIKGGILENRVIDSEGVIKLATMPPKEVLIAMLLGTMQAPVSRLLSILQAPMRNFLVVLKSLADQKEKAGSHISSNESENKQESVPAAILENTSEERPEENQVNQEEN